MNESMYSPCRHPADPNTQDHIDEIMEAPDTSSEINSGNEYEYSQEQTVSN